MRVTSIPWHGKLGGLLVVVFWGLNWSLTGFRTHLLFFPLWLGYILAVDGFVAARKGNSLLRRSGIHCLWLFALSIPIWWLFEALNSRVQNWEYTGSDALKGFPYIFWASLNFSTVIPAVFVTAEWFSTFVWTENRDSRPLRLFKWKNRPIFLATGILMLVLLLAFPRYAYAFMWLSLFLILDPINAMRGQPSLLDQLARGRSRICLSLAAGALTCGFYWELWNFYSNPKWIYHVPFLDFVKIFEMPILGYGGYIPFAWELYAFYQIVRKPLGAPELAWD